MSTHDSAVFRVLVNISFFTSEIFITTGQHIIAVKALFPRVLFLGNVYECK
jgi:hypothetical protein